jgi:thiosulfate/3-mercaptopyruvate sulfurtransferase
MRRPISWLSIQALLLLASVSSLVAAEQQYAHPELLVEPAAIERLASKPSFVLLDARPVSDYIQGHIGGARSVDAASWAKTFGDGSDVQAWAGRIAELGIDRDSTVVVYDAVANKDAARVWWILRYWGVDDVRILNGGFAGAQTAKLKFATEAPAPPQPSKFVPQPHDDRLATKGELLAALPGKSLQVVDARSEAEHCGLDSLANRRAGSIPGAKHLDWVDLVDQETKRFKPAGELARLFRSSGIDPTLPTAAHCQSGGRSSVMVFALELMGAERVSNYYASWGEWGNADDTPIEKPKLKESTP